jgi:phosphoribosylamine--glycine ligase
MKMIQSPLCDTLLLKSKGNSNGIATNAAMSPTDFEAIKAFVIQENVTMVKLYSEDPLVKGHSISFLNDPALTHGLCNRSI